MGLLSRSEESSGEHGTRAPRRSAAAGERRQPRAHVGDQLGAGPPLPMPAPSGSGRRLSDLLVWARFARACARCWGGSVCSSRWLARSSPNRSSVRFALTRSVSEASITSTSRSARCTLTTVSLGPWRPRRGRHTCPGENQSRALTRSPRSPRAPRGRRRPARARAGRRSGSRAPALPRRRPSPRDRRRTSRAG